MKLKDENGKEYDFDLDEWGGSLMGGVLREIKPKPHKIRKIDMSVCIESGIDNNLSGSRGMSDFKREERYYVIKKSQLTNLQIHNVPAFLSREEIPTVECVVTESDWDCYEGVWSLIQKEAESKQPKKIDMSVLILSGIDCEFSTNNFKRLEINKLQGVFADGFTPNDGLERLLEYCRPRFSHIHASPKGYKEMPIPEGFLVRVWEGDNEYTDGDCEAFNWNEVVMFSVTGIQEGFEL